MKKTILKMKPIIILAMILSLGITSCKKGWWGYEDGPGGGGNGGGNDSKTHVQGTVYGQECGLGIYGNGLWIRLDDGTLLQPCDQSFQTLVPIELNEGDRVELSCSSYKGSYPSFEKDCKIKVISFKRATIDFINVLGGKTDGCKPIPILENFEERDAAMVNILDAKVVDSKLKLHIGFGGCSPNNKRFSAIALLNYSNDIPTYEIKLVDANPELCQAYFTDDLCFDLESIRKPSSSKRVRVILSGSNQIFEF